MSFTSAPAPPGDPPTAGIAGRGLRYVAALVAGDPREKPAGEDRARLRSGHIDGGSVPVRPLHEEPLPAARVDKDPPAPQLLAVQREDDPALAKRLVEAFIALELVRPDVPDHDRTAAVLALGDHTLEARVVERVVLHGHRETLDLWIGRWTLGDSPRYENAAGL